MKALLCLVPFALAGLTSCAEPEPKKPAPTARKQRLVHREQQPRRSSSESEPSRSRSSNSDTSPEKFEVVDGPGS
jgi:hypothetical protein